MNWGVVWLLHSLTFVQCDNCCRILNIYTDLKDEIFSFTYESVIILPLSKLIVSAFSTVNTQCRRTRRHVFLDLGGVWLFDCVSTLVWLDIILQLLHLEWFRDCNLHAGLNSTIFMLFFFASIVRRPINTGCCIW